MNEFEINEYLLEKLDDNTYFLFLEIQKSFNNENYLLGILAFRVFILHVAGHLKMEKNKYESNDFEKSLDYIKKKGFSAKSISNEDGNEVIKELKNEINSINHDWDFEFKKIANFKNAKIYWSWIIALLEFLYEK